jgi:hypothetical protein
VLVKTPNGAELWLAYGMNLHAGGGVEAVEDAIRGTVLPLRERLAVRGPFGVSLRFDGEGVRRLAEDDAARVRLRRLLQENALVPFTANGFVVGRFHGAGVKERVYAPTWREAQRVEYTRSLAETMAYLRGTGETVSISTMPGSWRLWESGPAVDRHCAQNLALCARHLRDLEHRTGTRVLLAVEPEPGCTLERTSEAVAFWRGPLAEALRGEASAARHLGLCLDVCHQAVLHEDLAESLDRLAAARVPVHKVQASCALHVDDPSDPAARAALAAFDEPVYLHQVGGPDRASGTLGAPDLRAALEDSRGEWTRRRPWRVHFHVPVFRDRAVPPLRTTRDDLDLVLRRVAEGGVTSHVEIETYTWDVLPEEERRAGSGFDLVEALAREYEHVLGVLLA